jgi:DNA-binding MarR family transcriptional regulator
MTLFRLKEKDEIDQDVLSKEMGINKANTSRNLAKLKQNGFIEINQNPTDQRRKQVVLTPKAYEEMFNIEKILREIHKEMIKGLDEESLTNTLNTLNKMKNNLSEKKL